MKTNELRIGNLVRHEDYESDEDFRIASIRNEDGFDVCETIGGKNGTWSNNIDLINPVMIDDSYLRRLGFMGTDDSNEKFIHSKSEHHVIIHNNRFMYRVPGVTLREIKFVHQLQNVFFSLTDYDLELNDY